jgi:hypothetical protein
VNARIRNSGRRNIGLHAPLDHGEHHQARDAGAQQRDHARTPPPRLARAVRPDPVRDRDHDQDQPEREGDVARPVDRRATRLRALLELQVGPDGPEQPHRNGDQEHQPPVDRREQPAEHQADEQPADADDVVDAERHPALIGGERVGDDRGGVREQERRADPLDDAKGDQVRRARASAHPVDRQQQRCNRVDDEAEVVHLHAPVHVPQPSEADDQHARDDEEAEDHPQQVEAVRRLQRVEVDPAEDRRHRDQRDRRVERRKQHAERRVRQRDPLVAVVVRRAVAVLYLRSDSHDAGHLSKYIQEN